MRRTDAQIKAARRHYAGLRRRKALHKLSKSRNEEFVTNFNKLVTEGWTPPSKGWKAPVIWKNKKRGRIS